MPGSYWIDLARGIVFSRGYGTVTDGDLLAHAKALGADPRFRATFRQIVDFRDLSEIMVTSDGVRSLAQIHPFHRQAHRAIVVSSDAVFGLTRMFALLADADPEHFGIFRSLEPAMEWVGLPATTPWPDAAPDAIFQVSAPSAPRPAR
ncbi:MAG: hypothetical protein ACM3JJ_06505 [Hyphomicrobiales bacterium]